MLRVWRWGGWLLPALALLCFQEQTPAQARTPAAETPALLLAVGDIADCTYNNAHHAQTAALVDTLEGDIALLGDLAYPNGSPDDFTYCYDPAWGRHTPRVRPVPGNHEYITPGAAGYFAYFGAAASPLEPDCRVGCQGYYSYDFGAWHIVALNSEQEMDAGSAQEQWLRADLAANRTRCTLAYWHHPRFSSGAHGSNDHSAGVWQALYEAGVDVVLNGHEHHYERFAPQNPAGAADGHGIRQFIVGTGGTRLRSIGDPIDNSEVYNDVTWGVLQLALFADHYTWDFIPIDGQPAFDSGSAPCVTLAGDWATQHFLPHLSNH